MRESKGKRKNRSPLALKYKDTILLIVENSEVAFFNRYFREYLQTNHQISIKCEPSGSSNKCNILNFRKMENRINIALEDDGYKSVFLMLDLKTNCSNTGRNHTCLVKLKKEYQHKYEIRKDLKDRFIFFVVCNEIESWFLTIDRDTNNISENHKQDLKEFLNVSSEKQIVEKMIKELKAQNYSLNFSHNHSLNYFIKKLQEA
ncbi:MAG: hypothetical protein QM493_01380 [Sulfurovum sp.]